jgi:hypothetical protein
VPFRIERDATNFGLARSNTIGRAQSLDPPRQELWTTCLDITKRVVLSVTKQGEGMYLNSLSPGFERRPIYFEVPEIEGAKQVGSDCDARDQMYRSRGRKLLRRIPRSSRSESSDSGGLMINATSPTTFLGCAILEAIQGYCTCRARCRSAIGSVSVQQDPSFDTKQWVLRVLPVRPFRKNQNALQQRRLFLLGASR